MMEYTLNNQPFEIIETAYHGFVWVTQFKGEARVTESIGGFANECDCQQDSIGYMRIKSVIENERLEDRGVYVDEDSNKDR